MGRQDEGHGGGLGRALLLLFSLLVLAGLAAGGYRLHVARAEKLAAVPPPEKFPWALRAARVAQRELTAGFPVLATLVSEAEIDIMPQISGVIREMGPREGEAVAKGQLLVRLDTEEMENELAAKEAALTAARHQLEFEKKELTRVEAVYAKGYATTEAVDRQRTRVTTAEQRVRQLEGEIRALRTRIAYGTIRAPVDGFVAARLEEPGDLAAPGRPIYRITAATGAKVRVSVPQSVAAQLREGSEIELYHGDRVMSVHVTRVFPALDELSMGTAEADLDTIPFGLPSGARLPSRVILERWTNALVVPRSALVLAPDGTRGTVFRIVAADDGSPGRLQRVTVRLIGSGRGGVAVTGGLKAGDMVALAQESQLLRLGDGDRVLAVPTGGDSAGR